MDGKLVGRNIIAMKREANMPNDFTFGLIFVIMHPRSIYNLLIYMENVFMA
jgi:hypothetical protein